MHFDRFVSNTRYVNANATVVPTAPRDHVPRDHVTVLCDDQLRQCGGLLKYFLR